MKNKNTILVILITFINLSIVNGQDKVKINISFGTDVGRKFTALNFGADTSATTGLDKVLGEKDLPNLKPPGDVHGWFIFFDSVMNSTIVSYVDMKPFPKEGNNPVIYKFEVQNIVRYINFTWDIINSPLIDSIFLEDNFDDIFIVRENMKEKTAYSHDTWKSALDNFFIKVWYKTGNTAVVEQNEVEGSNITIQDNTISFRNDIDYFKMFSLTGQLIVSSDNNLCEKTIKMDNLDSGVYFLQYTDIHGRNFNHKILKY